MLYLVGAGGFAAEAAYVIKFSDKKEFDGYLSDNKEEWNKKLPFGKVVGSIESVTEQHKNTFSQLFFLPAVGSPKLKMKFVERALRYNWKSIGPVAHSYSFIGDAALGNGSIICSMCSITTNVRIGEYVNVNLNCTVGHDVIIEDYVNLSPHCTISGKVHLKRGCDLGSAVSVLPGVTIGENSIIGAGATIVEDVPDNVVVIAKGTKGQVVRNI